MLRDPFKVALIIILTSAIFLYITIKSFPNISDFKHKAVKLFTK